jgi:hypothetical protein
MVLFLLELDLLLKIGVRRAEKLPDRRGQFSAFAKMRAKKGLGRRAERGASMAGNEGVPGRF